MEKKKCPWIYKPSIVIGFFLNHGRGKKKKRKKVKNRRFVVTVSQVTWLNACPEILELGCEAVGLHVGLEAPPGSRAQQHSRVAILESCFSGLESDLLQLKPLAAPGFL